MQVPNTINTSGAPRPFIPAPRPLFDTAQKLPGRFVSCEDDISLQEIPMDNSISYFPTQDLSKIYIRQWNKQGKLEGLTYVLSKPESPSLPPPPPPISTEVSKQEDALTTALTSLNQGLANTFNQFGSTLQGMQQTLNNLADRFGEPSDGGMG